MKKTDRKPLVAVFTNNDDDIYCFRKELIEQIRKNGYDVLISCPYGEKFELMKDIEYQYDNPVIDRRGTNIVADAKLFLHYFNLLRKKRPDVVLTYTVKPNIYCGIAAHILRIPVISNVTGYGSVMNSGIIKKIVMSLLKFTLRRTACTMYQNSTNMAFAQKSGFIKGNGILIPGSGVNTERFSLLPYPDGGNGIEGEPIIFNYIGRILHDKGIDDLLEAAKIIKKSYPNTQFNLIGFIEPTEAHYEKILSELEGQGIIRYHGSQADVRPYIAVSHATVHPSTYGEGMSNVLLESASSGRPLISTDNPGCMETIKNNETGLIYRGGSVEELCEKIKIFLEMPNLQRKEMGEKGRIFMQESFSRKIVTNTYIEKINEVCFKKQ